MGLYVVGMAVGLVMGLVIVYCMGSVYSKVALCEWVTEWGQWQLKKSESYRLQHFSTSQWSVHFHFSFKFYVFIQLSIDLQTGYITYFWFDFYVFFLSDNIYIFALALSPMFCPQRLPLPLPSILSWNIRAK